MEKAGANISSMNQIVQLATPLNFSFRHTVLSHGWSDLLPFEVDELGTSLSYTFRDKGKVVKAEISQSGSMIEIALSRSVRNSEPVKASVKHILRLDDQLDGFYHLAKSDAALAWAAECYAGRLLRSPTVWEDLVKTMCTTNCSWSLTKSMVGNIVRKLGTAGPKSSFAFPTAKALAAVDEDFYRREIKAGYRSPYFVELAEKVISGEIKPESWLNSDLSTSELKKEIKQVKGIGDYAADNMLKLLGRYDGMALDSWLRAQFYKKHNRGKVCPDKKIDKHYSKYGQWQGLAIWCDMTKDWFEEKLNVNPDLTV